MNLKIILCRFFGIIYKVKVSKYSSLNECVKEIGKDKVILVLNKSIIIDNSLIIPKNITIRFKYGYKIYLNKNAEITIKNSQIIPVEPFLT